MNLRWDSEAGRQSSTHRGIHPPKTDSKDEKETSELHAHAASQSKLYSSHGIWDPTPISTTTESAAARTSSLRQISEAATPQLSSNTFWPMSPGTVAGSESEVCEDLSSFFEIAGEFYFDPQPGSNIAAGADVGLASR